MAKTFAVKRTYEGMTVMATAIADFHQEVGRTESLYGQTALAVAEPLLILASMYYVMEDYEQAEPLLARYVAIAKEHFGTNSVQTFRGLWLISETCMYLNRFIEGMSAGTEAKAISREIGFGAEDPLIEALFRRAEVEKAKSNRQSRHHGFVLALMAVSLCVTGGLNRSSTGAQALDRLRIFLRSYGNGEEEWKWTVKHAHLTRYDFIGLLSILIHHTSLKTGWLESASRKRQRLIEVR